MKRLYILNADLIVITLCVCLCVYGQAREEKRILEVADRVAVATTKMTEKMILKHESSSMHPGPAVGLMGSMSSKLSGGRGGGGGSGGSRRSGDASDVSPAPIAQQCSDDSGSGGGSNWRVGMMGIAAPLASFTGIGTATGSAAAGGGGGGGAAGGGIGMGMSSAAQTSGDSSGGIQLVTPARSAGAAAAGAGALPSIEDMDSSVMSSPDVSAQRAQFTSQAQKSTAKVHPMPMPMAMPQEKLESVDDST